MSEYQTIREFVVGNRVYGHFLIFHAEDGLTNDKKKPYIDLKLMDRTGMISAKQWDALPAQIEMLKRGMLVYATGTVKEYKNTPQLTIEHIELAPATFRVEDFIACAPIDAEQMMKDLMFRVHAMQDETIRAILQWGIAQAGEKLWTYPAAKGMHHAVYSGLLYHIISMLEIADLLLQRYTKLNRDLVIFGIIWHDIEKINEVDAEFGQVTERTVPGELLGHITQAVALIERAMIELEIKDDELRWVLQHIILTHHGKPEWGSPVAPKVPEAFLLHEIDNLDAKMYAINQAFENRKEDARFTEPIRSIDNIRMYHFSRKL